MKENKMKPGERLFSVCMLVFSVWLLAQSISMFKDSPNLTSYGAMPLVISIIMTACMVFVVFFEDRGRASENDGGTLAEKLVNALRYAVPKDVAVFTLMVIGYIAAVLLGVSFLVSSGIFLLAAITYLMPKDRKTMIGNVIFAGILLLLLFMVFQLIFKVNML